MLRTSHSTNHEISPLFYKGAIFIMQINRYISLYPGAPASRPPHQITKDMIQNLDVFWDLRGDQHTCAKDIKAFQWDVSIDRKRCRIFFSWSPPPCPCFFGNNHLKALQTLAGFETVEFCVRRQNYRSHGRHDPVDFAVFDTPRDGSWSVKPMYDALRKGLEPTFGVAELYGDEISGDRLLVFHPRR